MPTYDFTCKSCNHQFSLFTSISGKKEAKCPKCGSQELTQRMTGFLYAKSGGGNNSGSSCSGGSCSGCSGC
ncbi:MAG: zinc ribbon domain-containing protein [Clostridia bacterium]|jgi:putative FmdB family regulatory protein|nr:zinc ribbon domain-containing protein [Clostridia bacterium]